MPLDLKTIPPKNHVLIILIVLGLISTSIISFYLGRGFDSKPTQTSNNTPPLLTVKGAEVLQTQTASLVGKIIKIENDKLFVADKNGKVADFTVIPTVLVSKPIGGKSVASQSGGIKNLELNKDVLINLVARNGEYTITSVTYLPPVPSFPVSSSSGSAKK